jgi:hypothetical protein
MRIRIFLLASFILALGAIYLPGLMLSRESPFGYWSTERGQTIQVLRNGRFKYCDRDQCEWGRYIYYGGITVTLVNFYNMKITERLRTLSGDEPDPGFGTGEDLGEGGLEGVDHFLLCGTRPCKVIGSFKGDVYRFVKLRDY